MTGRLTMDVRQNKYRWIDEKRIMNASKEAIRNDMPLSNKQRETIEKASKGSPQIYTLVSAAKTLGFENWHRKNVWLETPEEDGYTLCICDWENLKELLTNEQAFSKNPDDFIRDNSLPRELITRLLNDKPLTQDEMFLVD